MRKDKHTEADRLLRNGLDGLQPNSPSGSWERLAQRLDERAVPSTNDAANNQSDALLRERLVSLVPTYQPASWDDLQHRLEQQADADAQSLADEALSEQLTSIVPAYNVASWDVLNARLDNAESDEVLHHRLETAAPVPPLSGWAALAAKLELIAARRNAIYSYKFSELCLMLVFLLLLWRFFPAADGEQAAPLTPPAEPVAEITLPLIASETESSSFVAEASAAGAITAAVNETVEPLAESAAIDRLVKSNAPQVIQLEETSQVLTFDQEAEVVNPLAIELAPDLLLESNPPRPRVLTNEPAFKTNSPRAFYLRPFVSPWDFNQIVTPKQVVNDIILEQDIRISYGASAGVLLDVSYRKHSMQYGVIYGRRSYIPTVLKEVEDFLPGEGPIERRDTNYSRISIQSIKLPAVFQWELFDNKRWRMTADAGLAVNVNIWKKFQKSPTFDSDVLNWSRQTPQLVGGGRGGETENLNRIGARDLVFPEQGLLQGGSLLENVSMTAGLGFSIERYLSERTSVYVAPRFSRAIYYQKSSGVEPFNDRIHNNSVQFGTRILLGKQK